MNKAKTNYTEQEKALRHQVYKTILNSYKQKIETRKLAKEILYQDLKRITGNKNIIFQLQ